MEPRSEKEWRAEPRIDARAKVTGEAEYVEDLPDLPGMAYGAPLLHEERGSNLLLEDKLEWGDVEIGFKEAERIFEESYSSPSMFHHPMENVGGCVAQFVNDEIDLWAPTSSPFKDAPEIGQGTHNLMGVIASRTLGIPLSQIAVSQPDTALQLPFAGVSAQRRRPEERRPGEAGFQEQIVRKES